MTIVDAPLLALTADLPSRPLAPDVQAARSEVRAAVADLAAIPSGALDLPWQWPGKGEVETRYAFYRAYEIVERAAADAESALGGGPTRSGAVRAIAPATAARWDLHGLLHGISDADWDADPDAGEWTIRQTLGHIISGQRRYGLGTAWWLGQGFGLDDPALPPRTPEALWERLPDEATEAAGEPAEVTARLDATVDFSTERLAGLADDRLELGSRWSGVPVSVGFRLGRWSSHIREHTIQVEKTLDMLNRRPTEVARLVRLVLAAYGRLEAVVFGLPPEAAGATDIIARAVAEAREVAGSAAASARTGG